MSGCAHMSDQDYCASCAGEKLERARADCARMRAALNSYYHCLNGIERDLALFHMNSEITDAAIAIVRRHRATLTDALEHALLAPAAAPETGFATFRLPLLASPDDGMYEVDTGCTDGNGKRVSAVIWEGYRADPAEDKGE